MTAGIDPDFARALDRLQTPSLPGGFADRVVAATERRQSPAAVPMPRSGDRRGAWMRGKRTLIGVAALALMSATAAASGLFGDIGLRVPVLSALVGAEPDIEVVAQKPKARVVAPPREAAAESGTLEPPVVAPRLITEPQRAAITERVASRIERRMDRRAEMRAAQGLPVLPPGARSAIAQNRAERLVDYGVARREVLNERRQAGERFVSPAERRAVIAERARAFREGRSGPDAEPATVESAGSASQAREEALRQLREMRRQSESVDPQ